MLYEVITVKYTYDETNLTNVGDFAADIAIPYDPYKDQDFGMQFV